MSAEAPSLPGRSPYLAAGLAWLVPGLGHFWLGRRKTAAAFALLVAATFLAGLSFQGRLYSIEAGQPLTILATTYEYGCAYLLTGGLMNLLLVLDTWDIASGKKK